MRPGVTTALASIPLLISGCGLTDPYHHPQSRPWSSTPSTTATASPMSTSTSTSTNPGTPPTPTAATARNPGEHDEGAIPPDRLRLRAEAGAATPEAALARFARLYINWTASQLSTRSHQLAGLATGQAQAQGLALASRAPDLARYRVTNHGTITAIAPGRGPEQHRWAVVTNELTSGRGPYLGLPATSHVTWATLIHTRHGYVLSGWYPAS